LPAASRDVTQTRTRSVQDVCFDAQPRLLQDDALARARELCTARDAANA
jgi:hypothetical protein